MQSKLQELTPVHQLGGGGHFETGHLLGGDGRVKDVRLS